MMRRFLSKLLTPRSRKERLADEMELPSLGELRMAKALGKYRRASGQRSADAVRRLDEAMAGPSRDA